MLGSSPSLKPPCSEAPLQLRPTSRPMRRTEAATGAGLEWISSSSQETAPALGKKLGNVGQTSSAS